MIAASTAVRRKRWWHDCCSTNDRWPPIFDAHTAWLRKDTGLLATRIVAAQRWLENRPETEDLPLGVFAAGPASAAALAATRNEPAFAATVCWTNEARPDDVRPSTLFVAGKESLETVADLGTRWFERHLASAWLPSQVS